MALGLRSIVCVPLQLEGTTLGVIYVDNRLQVGLFMPDDLELLAAIASSAAIAIENARLYQVAVEKGRMERELQVAREVQASLILRQTPRVEGWEFAAFWQPARQVAGDFYDFIPITLAKISEPSQGLVQSGPGSRGLVFSQDARANIPCRADRGRPQSLPAGDGQRSGALLLDHQEPNCWHGQGQDPPLRRCPPRDLARASHRA
jgi:hypothetical protein